MKVFTRDMPSVELSTAASSDNILALQEENQPEQGGLLSARLPYARFETALNDLPIIVARRSEWVVGYLVSASCEVTQNVPVIAAMLRAYPGTLPDAPVLSGRACGERRRLCHRAQGIPGRELRGTVIECNRFGPVSGRAADCCSASTAPTFVQADTPKAARRCVYSHGDPGAGLWCNRQK
jgi:hypothetical protein